jgi:hypothetical protein
MKSVIFWRKNPGNEYSISSGKFRIQKIREIRSSQFIADWVRVYLHCASTTSTLCYFSCRVWKKNLCFRNICSSSTLHVYCITLLVLTIVKWRSRFKVLNHLHSAILFCVASFTSYYYQAILTWWKMVALNVYQSAF